MASGKEVAALILQDSPNPNHLEKLPHQLFDLGFDQPGPRQEPTGPSEPMGAQPWAGSGFAKHPKPMGAQI
jgi:hypothetical protein